MISVIICTYNRPNEIRRAIESILANAYSDYELLIVDQSNTDETREIVEKYIYKDSHIKYLYSSRSKSRALNLGVKKAEGEIIAFTDDDCAVSEDWLDKIVSTFDSLKTDSIVVFGSVKAAKHDIRKGFIPDNKIREVELKGPLSIKKVSFGIVGMNMIVKKTFFEKVGYFDEVLGPGAELKAAEEYDITYRALKKEFKILFVPGIKVEHYGFKSWEEATALFEGYVIGTIGTFCKHIRCMDFNAFLLLLVSVFTDLVEYTKSVVDRGLTVFSLLYILPCMYVIYFFSFLMGILKSMNFAVDKKNMVYRTKT
jgi:glycosyltransferase involved in cell wall biosynthesis